LVLAFLDLLHNRVWSEVPWFGKYSSG